MDPVRPQVVQPLNRASGAERWGGAVLTKELVEEAWEAAVRTDRLVILSVAQNGRAYQLYPKGFLRWRVLWNWLCGYRRGS